MAGAMPVLVGQQVQLPTIRPGFSATTPTTSCVGSWTGRRPGASDAGRRRRAGPRVAAERRRLGVEQERLVASRSAARRRSRSGPALRAARDPELAADRSGRRSRGRPRSATRSPPGRGPGAARGPSSSRPRSAATGGRGDRHERRAGRAAIAARRSDERPGAWRDGRRGTQAPAVTVMVGRRRRAGRPKSCTQAAPVRQTGGASRGRSDGGYRTMRTAPGPHASPPRLAPVTRVLEDSVPQIRPFRALRYVPRRRRRPRRGRRAAVRRHRRRSRTRSCWRATDERRPARPAAPRSPATSRTTGTAGPRGRSPRGGPTGRCARTRARRSTSTSRRTASPARDVERTQRGFFARLRLEPFGPGVGVLPHERTLAGAAARTATGCSGRRASTRARSSGCTTTRAGRGAPRARDGRAPAARRSTSPTTTASAIGCGRSRPTATRRPVATLLAARRLGPGDHRRRPPPLRDGAPLPRRAADDALVRGGPGVRLPPDAVPRADGPAADGAADPPRGARLGADGFARAARRARRAVRRDGRGPGRARRALRGRRRAGRGRGPVRARGRATARALLRARRGAFAALLAEGGDAVRGARRDLLGAALDALAGIDAAAVAGGRADRVHEVRGRGACGSSTPASDGADAAFLLEPTPVASIARRRRRRRRDAPEVDLLLPQGPDRPRASTRSSGEPEPHAR